MSGVFRWINQHFAISLLAGVIVGIILSFVMGDSVVVLKPLGKIFTRLLVMVVPVLVFFSIASSFANIGDAKRMKSWASKIIGWFILSMLISTFLGIAMGLIFKPGLGIELQTADFKVTEITADMFIEWLPKTFLGCIAEGNTIQIVFLSIFVGVAVVMMQEGK